MSLRRLYIRSLAIIGIVLTFSVGKGYSQGTDINSGKQPHFYIGFSFSPTQTLIANNGSTSISKITSETENSIAGACEAGYSFTRYFGVSIGIGYSSYITDLSLGAYDNNYDTTDNTESYKRIISGKDITEIQKISLLNIPISACFQLPINDNFGLYFQSGLNFSIPVTKSYTSSGTFTYTGYYQAYNIYITGVPYEGLEKDYPTADKGQLKLKSIITELNTSAGAQFNIQNKIQISLGILYCKSLSDISGYTLSTKYNISSKPNQMKSLMEGSTKASVSSFGLRIGFRYFLR